MFLYLILADLNYPSTKGQQCFSFKLSGAGMHNIVKAPSVFKSTKIFELSTHLSYFSYNKSPTFSSIEELSKASYVRIWIDCRHIFKQLLKSFNNNHLI